METIGESTIRTFLAGSSEPLAAKNTEIRRNPGHLVASFPELAQKVAHLQFLNSEHVLLFRGQNADHTNLKENSSLKPTIFRGAKGQNPSPDILEARFSRLRSAEDLLVNSYQGVGRERVERHRIVRWSIIQHYDITSTPLLDVTHSLRIAASFASHNCSGDAYIFVIGVPHLSGAITASADAGVQITRLSSMCPPVAVRPHIQEGYLLGEYPELIDFKQKSLYPHYEVDFGRRVVAKFRFKPESFWIKSKGFPRVSKSALYPSTEIDSFRKMAESIKRQLPSSL